MVHAVGAALEGRGEDGGEAGGAFAVHIARGSFVVVVRRGFGAIDAGAPFDDVEVELEDAALAENDFGDGDEREFEDLADDRAARPEEKIFHELLRDGGAPAKAAGALHVVLGGDFHGLPIEAVMLVEARVFGGDDGVLEIGRDLAERDEVVALAVGRGAKPGFDAAFRLDGGGGRVDPFGGDEGERGETPEKRGGDEEPLEDRAEKVFAARGNGDCVGDFVHDSG